jgi:hypothetical protein
MREIETTILLTGKMANIVMKIVLDVDEYEQLKLAASKLAESE